MVLISSCIHCSMYWKQLVSLNSRSDTTISRINNNAPLPYLKEVVMVVFSPGLSRPTLGCTEKSWLVMTSSSCLSTSSSCPVSAQYSGSRCMSEGNWNALHSGGCLQVYVYVPLEPSSNVTHHHHNHHTVYKMYRETII